MTSRWSRSAPDSIVAISSARRVKSAERSEGAILIIVSCTSEAAVVGMTEFARSILDWFGRRFGESALLGFADDDRDRIATADRCPAERVLPDDYAIRDPRIRLELHRRNIQASRFQPGTDFLELTIDEIGHHERRLSRRDRHQERDRALGLHDRTPRRIDRNHRSLRGTFDVTENADLQVLLTEPQDRGALAVPCELGNAQYEGTRAQLDTQRAAAFDEARGARASVLPDHAPNRNPVGITAVLGIDQQIDSKV